MKTTKIELIKLTASVGMTLTNGETYGKEIYLGKSDAPENWYEITDAEAEELQAAEQPETDKDIEPEGM